MKRLITPPIQWLFWLAGFAMLGLALWSMWNLYTLAQTKEQQANDSANVVVPDMSVLEAPSVASYRHIVMSPLFWDERKPPMPAIAKRLQAPRKPAAPPPPPPVDKTLPEGRLVGIIDMGIKSYGVMRGDEETYHLRKGDKWGNWEVATVEKERLILELEGDRHIIPLIGDFEAPKENANMVAAKRLQKQQKLREESLARLRARQAQREQAKASQEPKNGMPNPVFPAEIKKEPPVLSIKDALDARRRLMESRWGSILGSELPSVSANSPQPSESKQ